MTSEMTKTPMSSSGWPRPEWATAKRMVEATRPMRFCSQPRKNASSTVMAEATMVAFFHSGSAAFPDEAVAGEQVVALVEHDNAEEDDGHQADRKDEGIQACALATSTRLS